ncbi:MAG: FHA domain-containing protein [Myxococcota bacterium]
MGRLEHTASNVMHLLRSQEVIGRSRECTFQVDDPSVSGLHASLAWTGAVWVLRDASSLNGTFVDGARVEPGKAVRVDRGSEIQFGRSTPWRLTKAGPPLAHATCSSTDTIRTMEGGILEFGDAASPTCLVHNARTHSYWIETPQDRYLVDDGEVVLTGDRRWRLHLPEAIIPTSDGQGAPQIDQLRAEFRISPDEEHVSLTLRTAGRHWDLTTKAHHYTLVTLARHRLADIKAGLGPAEAGWIDRHALRDELKIGDNLLYTHLFRARNELRELGIEHAAALVERRSGAGQLRIGIRDLEVLPII